MAIGIDFCGFFASSPENKFVKLHQMSMRSSDLTYLLTYLLYLFCSYMYLITASS